MMYEVNTAFCNNCFFQIRTKDKLHPQENEKQDTIGFHRQKSILLSMKDSLSSVVI